MIFFFFGGGEEEKVRFRETAWGLGGLRRWLGSRGPFLESPGNFSGPELYFKIKIYRMVV